MVLNVMMPDRLITCPLDESHRILKGRMQFHLVRCLKNHKLVEKIKCPWNPLHIIDKFAYEDHWRNKCEDLPNVRGSVSVVNAIQDTNKSNIAIVPSSVTDAKLPPMEEDWDAERYKGTYDPIKNSEDKPILRMAIGLSKARKKEWRRQERLRHQQLDEFLPLKPRSTPKENIMLKDSCRPPRSPGIAMSANASTIDECNTRRTSTDRSEVRKLPTNLRPPHAPSAGLTHTPDETISGGSLDRPRTLFDEAFGFEGEPIYGTSTDKCLANAMTELESLRGDSDARSCESGTSTSSRGSGQRKLLGQPADAARKSFATAAASFGTKGRAKIESVGKVQLQDEAACISFNEPTSVKRASTAVDDDVVAQLSWRLANLESTQKKIQEKAELLVQFPQIAQESINVESTVANGGNCNDSSSKRGKGSSLVKSNFAKLKKSKNLPSVERAGRGRSLVDFDSSKNRKSGGGLEKENTNSFV